jgi:hypothetical protein
LIDINGLIDGLTSHASATGLFDSVNGHEPKGSPGFGLTYSIWVEEVNPADSSGLASTSVVITFTARLYMPFKTQPEDSIDPNMVSALDVLMTAYAGDFTLNDRIRNIDVRGQEGQKLGAKSGYLEADRTNFRIIDITIPCIINDAWTEAP